MQDQQKDRIGNRFLYAEYSIKDRLQLYQNMAIKQEIRNYGRSMEAAEIAIEEKRYTADGIEIEMLEEQLKNITDEYKSKIKALEAKQKERRELVKSGKKQVSGTLYGIANQFDGLLMFYNEYGELVDSRPLLANERQGNMFIGQSQPVSKELKFESNTEGETHDAEYEDVPSNDEQKVGSNKDFGEDFEAGGESNVELDETTKNAMIHDAAKKGEEPEAGEKKGGKKSRKK